MSLSDRIKSFRTQLNNEFKQKTSSSSQVSSVEFGISEIPKIKEIRGKDYVLWGENNDYPQKISDLKYGSGIHNAILSTAADMISGDGFLINGATTLEESAAKVALLTPEQKTAYDLFVSNPYGKMNLNEVLYELAVDAKEIGGIAYEVIFNSNFTKISTINYMDIRDLRAGKLVNGSVQSYWYSRDWANCNKAENKPREIVVFDPKRKKQEHLNQIVYLKRGKLDYYPEPDWIGCLTWIQTDYQMGIFHLSNIENGMNPSMKLQFYKLPASENEKQYILDEIRTRFTGAKKSGKHMVFFSDGKEDAPDISPIAVSNLDKQLILLAELCDQKILTGNKLTSPLLAGISVRGQLGGNTELEKAYRIYDKTRMKPYRNMIASSFNKILDFNKAGFKIDIAPFDPFN